MAMSGACWALTGTGQGAQSWGSWGVGRQGHWGFGPLGDRE